MDINIYVIENNCNNVDNQNAKSNDMYLTSIGITNDDIKTYHNLWINFLTAIRNRMKTVDDSVDQIHQQSLQNMKNNLIKTKEIAKNIKAEPKIYG